MMRRDTLREWRRVSGKFGFTPTKEGVRTLIDSHLQALNTIDLLKETAPMHDVQTIIGAGIRNYVVSEGTARSFHCEGGTADDALRKLHDDSQILADCIQSGLTQNGYAIIRLDPPTLNLDTSND